MKYFVLITFALCIIFFSCGEQNAKNEKDIFSDITLKFMDSLVVKNKMHGYSDVDSASLDYQYSFLIFGKGNGEVGKKIDRVCYDLLADNVAGGKLDSNAYNASAKNLIQSFEESMFSTPGFNEQWLVQSAMSLRVNKQNVLGIEFMKETELAENRKTKQILFVNFKIEDGSIIHISDLISDEYYDEFERIAESSFRKRYNIEQSVGWERTPFTMFADGFRLNDNFLIIETGLLYVFNPFDAAVMEDKHFEMIIAWKDIEHLISEDNIVKNFISKT